MIVGYLAWQFWSSSVQVGGYADTVGDVKAGDSPPTPPTVSAPTFQTEVLNKQADRTKELEEGQQQLMSEQTRNMGRDLLRYADAALEQLLGNKYHTNDLLGAKTVHASNSFCLGETCMAEADLKRILNGSTAASS